MAAVTPAATTSAQGIFRILRFSSVSDADTFASAKAPKAFWAFSTFNPTTQGSAGVNVTYGSGSYTFYPGENTTTGLYLFIVEG